MLKSIAYFVKLNDLFTIIYQKVITGSFTKNPGSIVAYTREPLAALLFALPAGPGIIGVMENAANWSSLGG